MQKITFLDKYLLGIAACLALLLAGGCTSASPAQTSAPIDTEIPFQSLAHGFRLTLPQADPALRLVTEQSSLTEVAAMIDPEQQSMLQSVNLEREAVLAAIWGLQPTGGSSITIRTITLTGNQLRVEVNLNKDDPQAPRIDASTIPYHLVTIDPNTLPQDGELVYQMVSDGKVLAEGALR